MSDAMSDLQAKLAEAQERALRCPYDREGHFACDCAQVELARAEAAEAALRSLQQDLSTLAAELRTPIAFDYGPSNEPCDQVAHLARNRARAKAADDLRAVLASVPERRDTTQPDPPAASVEGGAVEGDKTADILIAALHVLVDEWKELSGLPTPLTFASLEGASQSAKTLYEAAHDLDVLLTERTPLSYEDEARAYRFRLVALDTRTRIVRPVPVADPDDTKDGQR